MRVWIAEKNDETSSFTGFEVSTSLPKIKGMISSPEKCGTWVVYRCDVGKPSIDKICALLRKENYEEKRDNEITFSVDENGVATKQ